MRSQPAELDVWFLAGSFVYFQTSCVRTANALARLRRCDKYYNQAHELARIYHKRFIQFGGRLSNAEAEFRGTWVSSQ